MEQDLVKVKEKMNQNDQKRTEVSSWLLWIMGSRSITNYVSPSASLFTSTEKWPINHVFITNSKLPDSAHDIRELP